MTLLVCYKCSFYYSNARVLKLDMGTISAAMNSLEPISNCGTYCKPRHVTKHYGLYLLVATFKVPLASISKGLSVLSHAFLKMTHRFWTSIAIATYDLLNYLEMLYGGRHEGNCEIDQLMLF